MRNTSSVPHLSRNDIDLKAEELLEWFDKKRLQEPSLTPLAEIAQRMAKDFSVRFIFTEPLGTTSDGKLILGSCHFPSRTIQIDPSLLSNGPRFNFTLAHEIGHLILHRKLRLDFRELDTPIGHIQDGRSHIRVSRHSARTPRDWLEWQADYFASALLIPRATLRQAIVDKQSELGVNRRLGIIYLDNQPLNRHTHKMVLYHLRIIYQASRTVINIRLKHLGLIEDRQNFSVRHITQLLREE